MGFKIVYPICSLGKDILCLKKILPEDKLWINISRICSLNISSKCFAWTEAQMLSAYFSGRCCEGNSAL